MIPGYFLFKKVFFEFNTIEPPIDVEGNNVEFICDSEGNAIGFRKKTSNLKEYSYDLRIFEDLTEISPPDILMILFFVEKIIKMDKRTFKPYHCGKKMKSYFLNIIL